MRPIRNDDSLGQPDQPRGSAAENNTADEGISTPPKGAPKRRGEEIGTSARVPIGTPRKAPLRF